jgi:hypothetical protein
MPPYINVEPYRAEILQLLSQNITQKAIRAMLLENYQVSLSRNSLTNRLREWQHPPRTKRSDIYDRVQELLPRHNTENILRILAAEGTPSSERTVDRLQSDLGVKLRLSPQEREQQLDDIEAILIAESIIGEIQDFGRRTLHRHLRAIGLFYTEKQVCAPYSV